MVLLVFVVSLSGQNCQQHLSMIELLIRNTFNGYTCINVYYSSECKELCKIYSVSTLQKIHEIQYSVRVLPSLSNGDQQCGYVLVGSDGENLPILNDLLLHEIVRVLFLQILINDNTVNIEVIENDALN